MCVCVCVCVLCVYLDVCVYVCMCVCVSFTGPWLSAQRGCRGLETVEIGCRMCLFLSPCTAERRLVADGNVFSLTVCGLTRIYLRPVPVRVLFLLVLGFGRFVSSARVCVCVCCVCLDVCVCVCDDVRH